MESEKADIPLKEKKQEKVGGHVAITRALTKFRLRDYSFLLMAVLFVSLAGYFGLRHYLGKPAQEVANNANELQSKVGSAAQGLGSIPTDEIKQASQGVSDGAASFRKILVRAEKALAHIEKQVDNVADAHGEGLTYVKKQADDFFKFANNAVWIVLAIVGVTGFAITCACIKFCRS